jgi:hypothetical protein
MRARSPSRVSLLAAAVFSLLLPGVVQAQEVLPVEPVCGSPEVLRALTFELEARGVSGELDPGSVGEHSAPGAATALCSVNVLLPFYDRTRFGGAPQFQMMVRRYRVRRQSKSLLVTLLD